MSTFLDRLKDKKVLPSTPEDDKRHQVAAQQQASVQVTPTPTSPAEQLKVDIFQTPTAMVIYAQIAGVTLNDYAVTIEGDGDVVTIKGERSRPNGEHFTHDDVESKESILEECSWGKFYRQIILPAEVDAPKTQAKMKDGVLMLLLPLKAATEKGVRIQVTQVS